LSTILRWLRPAFASYDLGEGDRVISAGSSHTNLQKAGLLALRLRNVSYDGTQVFASPNHQGGLAAATKVNSQEPFTFTGMFTFSGIRNPKSAFAKASAD